MDDFNIPDLPTPEDTAKLETNYLTKLGERVRNIRAQRGMTRKILARDSKVSERYLAQLEMGQGNISINLLR
ncbi:MAG: helix-turn-helix domain-containing protein, partial [Oxalobacteraceae bacterium]